MDSIGELSAAGEESESDGGPTATRVIDTAAKVTPVSAKGSGKGIEKPTPATKVKGWFRGKKATDQTQVKEGGDI